MESDILLLDLKEEALNNMSPFDPLSKMSQIVCFEYDYPYEPESLMVKADEWVWRREREACLPLCSGGRGRGPSEGSEAKTGHHGRLADAKLLLQGGVEVSWTEV